MQINRNNNMGLIVAKEEKRCSIFGVVSWRKKRKIQFDSKKKNSIQFKRKLWWAASLWVTEWKLLPYTRLPKVIMVIAIVSNLSTTKYQEVRIFCKREIGLSARQQISYLCVRFIGRNYVFNFFSQTNLYQNNQCLLCRKNGGAKLQELNQLTFMHSVMSSSEIAAAWLRSLFASWGEMLSSAALLIRLSFSLCDLRYDTLDN